ncbi:response regulator [Sulfitobacter sp. S0837]|uniref:response regulator n=1 Tax=Sulfitobacter maritimus TaxID=2741719 RepID=UPI001582A281|nr:response regulator [Sulfitobacter maritimus]NUH65549.1 response regulator [Sulfitobacter maritimus]
MKAILHVDDDPLVLDIVQAIFRHSQGIKVTSAQSAEDALQLIPKLQPDLFIVDIAMPDIGGFELLLKLREMSEAKNTPIIILSGRVGSFITHNPFRDMASVILQKPVDPDRLRCEVDDILANGHFDED